MRKYIACSYVASYIDILSISPEDACCTLLINKHITKKHACSYNTGQYNNLNLPIRVKFATFLPNGIYCLFPVDPPA